MKTLDFEWKILEWFDRFESDFLNRCNQYISLILGSIGLIVILMIVYWTLNKEKGLIIAYNLFLAMLVNNLLKGLIMRKRPFENAGYEHLRKLDVAKDGATGSSFPSGHAMNSASLYTSLCCNRKYHCDDFSSNNKSIFRCSFPNRCCVWINFWGCDCFNIYFYSS